MELQLPNITIDLLMLLAIIIVASKVGGGLAKLLGQPAVFGELLVGLALGPTLLNLLHLPIFAPGNTPYLGLMVKQIAEIGVIWLMFLAGLETDIGEMTRVGRAAFNGALGGVLLPLGAGLAAALLQGYGFGEAIFIGTILTATSVSISAQTLIELHQLRSKEGATILGAAVIDDVMGLIVLSLVIAFFSKTAASASAGITGVAFIIIKMFIFFGAAITLGLVLFRKLGEWSERWPGTEVLLALVLGVVMLYSWAAQVLGAVAPITGAYIAGVLFAQTPFCERIEHSLQAMAYGFFVPVFFVSIGLEANARSLGGSLTFTLIIIGIAILTKVIGAGAGSKLAGFGWGESMRVGIGMISRGEVALIVAGYGLEHQIINESIFSIMVIMTLVTTLITPILLRLSFPRPAAKVPVRR
ncbi:MAG: cation:proton antiporter [Symbiobacteriia bacterium]